MNLVLGIIGMACILVAFILDEFSKKVHQNTVYYNVINIVGSALLLYYAVTLDSWPFIILNLVWLAAAVAKLISILLPKRGKKR